MANLDEAEVIDLTNIPCYEYTPRISSRRVLRNSNFQETCEVIDLINDSFCGETNELTGNSSIDSRKCSKDQEGKLKNKTDKSEKEKSKKIAECPICRNKLGTNPLASTKCGHVYCLTCIKESLKFNKLCPTCRCNLKGNSAYHPLFLELG